jgi:hypothetical protein
MVRLSDLFQNVSQITMNVKSIIDTQTDWTRLARRDDPDIDYSDAPAMLSEPKQVRIRYPDGQTATAQTPPP